MTTDEYEYLMHTIEGRDARIMALENVIKYALDIKHRCHGDDYAYDDCWKMMEDVLKDIQ
jgi:hypothetical protein